MENKKTILLALMTVILTIGVLWLTSRAVTPRIATSEDVLAEAQKGGYHIVSTEELAARYAKNPGSMLLVDTRQDWEFRTGHIKGAFNFPMEPTWWARWRKAGSLNAFLGTDKDCLIVFY